MDRNERYEKRRQYVEFTCTERPLLHPPASPLNLDFFFLRVFFPFPPTHFLSSFFFSFCSIACPHYEKSSRYCVRLHHSNLLLINHSQILFCLALFFLSLCASANTMYTPAHHSSETAAYSALHGFQLFKYFVHPQVNSCRTEGPSRTS